MPEIAIKVDKVNKSFKLPHERHSSLKSVFINLFKKKRTYEKQRVLEDISFEIKKGEFFGIVGRNGSGKSTLLKLIAGVYSPNSGTIAINGKLTPFIELGVGFNPELTGHENVYLNGALLGFDRKEMNEMYDEIVDFAELEKFMDQKLKNYSSGMQVRLAFSIAIRAKSDILLLDEVLAVGDAAFQKKCYEYFVSLKKNKQTVVIVTHDMSAVRRFCSECIIIDNGKIIDKGSPSKIAEKYEELNLRISETPLAKKSGDAKHEGDGQAVIKKVTTFNPQTNSVQNTFLAKESVGVRIDFLVNNKNLISPKLGFILQDENDITVFATNNEIAKTKTGNYKAGDEIAYETIIENNFTNGTYTITVAIENDDFLTVYDRGYYLHKFSIGGHILPHAQVHPSHKSSISLVKK